MSDKDRYGIEIESPEIHTHRAKDDPFHPTTAANTEAGIIWVVLLLSIVTWVFWMGIL